MGVLKDRLRMAALLFAVVAGFDWKITLTRQFDWLWGPDLGSQVLPWFEEQARAWGRGFPLWDPYMWGGQPLLAQAQPGSAYPLNWILFALPLHNGHLRWSGVQWYFVLAHFMAVGFCYWLCRDLGRSRTASVVGGVIFGLGGYVGYTVWPQMVNGALWLPLVLLFLLRAGRGRNLWGSAALSGMFLGLSWLSGHHQAPMFLALAAAGVWIYFIFRSGRLDWKLARAAALSMVLMAATGALQILPAMEYGRLAKRWAGAPDALSWNQPVPYTVHETYDLKPFNLFGIVFPDLKTNADPFVGVAALALAAIGLGAGWRNRRLRILAAVGIGGLVYALGHYSVFQGLLYGLVPALDKARVVSSAIVIFQLGVAAAAAFGVDRLLAPSSEPELDRWPRRVMWATLAFGAFTLAAFEFLLFSNHQNFPGPDTAMLTPFIALGVSALLYAAIREPGWKPAAVLMLLLILLELGNNMGPVFAPRSDPDRMKWLDQTRGNADIAAFLRTQPGFFRATVADNAFPENWGAYHDVEMWNGYLAGVTTNMLSFDRWRLPGRMLYGVAYKIAAKPPTDGGQDVFTGKSGMKVYRYGSVFPRSWAVHELWRARDADEGNHMIYEHLDDLHRKAFLFETPPPVETCGGPDQVGLVEHGINAVRIQARMACKGMVLLSDTYFPGWKAQVDGQAAPIYEADEAMRGVVVPAGNHTVTMRYRPASVMMGSVLSLAGILAAMVIAWRGRAQEFYGKDDGE